MSMLPRDGVTGCSFLAWWSFWRQLTEIWKGQAKQKANYKTSKSRCLLLSIRNEHIHSLPPPPANAKGRQTSSVSAHLDFHSVPRAMPFACNFAANGLATLFHQMWNFLTVGANELAPTLTTWREIVSPRAWQSSFPCWTPFLTFFSFYNPNRILLQCGLVRLGMCLSLFISST